MSPSRRRPAETVEYFVPRSVSDFHLTGVSDTVPVTTTRGVLRSRQDSDAATGSGGMSRSKMVTFEDDAAAAMTRKVAVEDVFM